MTITESRPQLATIATSNQFLPIGLDVGNGALKMVSSHGETLLESYLLYLPERASHANSGYVEYLSGSRSDLSGKQWIGGINAYYWSPSSVTRVTDDRDGKVAMCLQLLLSALSAQPHRPEWHLSVCASVHDGKVFGSAIRRALEGTHKLRLSAKETTVTIRVDKVLEEGSGVAIALKSQFDFSNALLYDLGNGTSIVSSFNGLQLTHRDYAPDAGVESLIDAIATCDQVRKVLLKPGDRHLIRQGIEKGDFAYGNRGDINFKSAYLDALPQWFESGLKPFVKTAEERIPSATAVIAVGGGSQLPGVTQLLAKKGIVVPPNARWCNAKGLYQLALRGVHR
jgi:Actin like proteins N terminal domain